MIEEIEGGVLCDGQFCDGKHGICPQCKRFFKPRKPNENRDCAKGA